MPTTLVRIVPVGRALIDLVKSIVNLPISICCCNMASGEELGGLIVEYAHIIGRAAKLAGAGYLKAIVVVLVASCFRGRA